MFFDFILGMNSQIVITAYNIFGSFTALETEDQVKCIALWGIVFNARWSVYMYIMAKAAGHLGIKHRCSILLNIAIDCVYACVQVWKKCREGGERLWVGGWVWVGWRNSAIWVLQQQLVSWAAQKSKLGEWDKTTWGKRTAWWNENGIRGSEVISIHLEDGQQDQRRCPGQNINAIAWPSLSGSMETYCSSHHNPQLYP